MENGETIEVKSKQQMMDWDVCSGYSTPPQCGDNVESNQLSQCSKLNF